MLHATGMIKLIRQQSPTAPHNTFPIQFGNYGYFQNAVAQSVYDAVLRFRDWLAGGGP